MHLLTTRLIFLTKITLGARKFMDGFKKVL